MRQRHVRTQDVSAVEAGATAAGQDMQRDRHIQILCGSPERIVLVITVRPVVRGRAPNEHAADSHFAAPLEFRHSRRDIREFDRAETENVGFTCEKYGANRLMWSSDYPHTDSPWPRSKDFIAKWIDTIDESEKYKVIGDNAAELYHVS